MICNVKNVRGDCLLWQATAVYLAPTTRQTHAWTGQTPTARSHWRRLQKIRKSSRELAVRVEPGLKPSFSTIFRFVFTPLFCLFIVNLLFLFQGNVFISFSSHRRAWFYPVYLNPFINGSSFHWHTSNRWNIILRNILVCCVHLCLMWTRYSRVPVFSPFECHKPMILAHYLIQ